MQHVIILPNIEPAKAPYNHVEVGWKIWLIIDKCLVRTTFVFSRFNLIKPSTELQVSKM